MKKILSSLVIILIVLLILWAVMGWYLGAKSEQEFRGFLQEASQLTGKRLFRAEVLAYKKKASGARAKIVISSDYPAVTQRVGELQLNVKLLNGPVFITRSGVSFGSSRWVISINEDEIGADSNTAILYNELFPKGLPSAEVRVDFEQKAHYIAKYKADFSESLITGVFDLETQNNRGAITLNDFKVGTLPNRLFAKKINISFQHQKAITTRYKPGTASLQVSSLELDHQQLSKSLHLDAKMNSDIALNNSAIDKNTLSGFIKSTISNANKAVDDFPIEKADVSLQFNGLPAEAFIAFSEANDALDNLHQQAQWVLEELGEVPEGQDQIWLLYDRIEESSNALPKLLVGQATATGEQLIQLKATTHYKNTSSHLQGNIKFENENPKLSSWLSLLDGEAQVELDKYLFKLIQKLVPITDPKFKLLLKDNKVLMTK